jgi:ABC-type sugar transport system ATPase subunit
MRLLSQKAMVQNTNEVLTRLRVTLPDLDAPVGLMSGGQRQAVAVARATAFSSRLVILDEPTAALGLREAARVLELITRLRNDQKAVVVISHAMDHVIEVADRAIVMRRGRTVGELVPSEESRERIVSLIVGGDG